MSDKKGDKFQVGNVSQMNREYVRLNAYEELMSEQKFTNESGTFDWDKITHENSNADRYFKQNIIVKLFKNKFALIIVAYIIIFILVVVMADNFIETLNTNP